MKKSPEFVMGADEKDVDFRATIELLMREKEMNIAQLARRADLNYGTVFYFLKGKSQMRTPNLERLFNILNQM